MEVVLVDAINEDVLGIATKEEECHGTQPHLAIDAAFVEGPTRERRLRQGELHAAIVLSLLIVSHLEDHLDVLVATRVVLEELGSPAHHHRVFKEGLREAGHLAVPLAPHLLERHTLEAIAPETLP